MNTVTNASMNKTARLAGFLYLLIAILSVFGLMYVPSSIWVEGDTLATANNLVASESLFRLGFFSNLLIFTLNVFVAVLLYQLFKAVNSGAAMLMVTLICVGLAIAMLNELNQLVALLLLRNAESLSAFTLPQLQSLAVFFLDIHQQGFAIAHIFWGLWLFPLAYLIIKSTYLPQWIGYLLVVAGVGYVVDFTLFFLAPGTPIKFSEFTFVGEVALLLWLLIMGVNQGQAKQSALVTA